MDEEVDDDGEISRRRVVLQGGEECDGWYQAQDEQRNPREEEEGGENFVRRYRVVFHSIFNKRESSSERPVDAGAEGRRDGDAEKKIELIRLGDNVKLQRRLRKSFK